MKGMKTEEKIPSVDLLRILQSASSRLASFSKLKIKRPVLLVRKDLTTGLFLSVRLSVRELRMDWLIVTG